MSWRVSQLFMAWSLYSEWSFGGPAAVDQHRTPGHERRGIAGEIDDGAGEVLDPSDASELDFFEHRPSEVRIAEEGFGQRCIDVSGAERVDPDPVRSEIDRHRLRDPLHCPLAGAIERTARTADVAHLRRHVDDRSAAGRFDQAAGYALCHEIGRANV